MQITTPGIESILALASNPILSVRSLVSYVAGLLKTLLGMFGITLSPAGYVVVALFVLSTLIYNIHRLTFDIIKAIALGVAVAILLYIAGIM